MERFDLLPQVAAFKSRFFASAWANYATAARGTLRLLPAAGRQPELQRDYAKMEPMFLKPPSFPDLIRTLKEAEGELNRL